MEKKLSCMEDPGIVELAESLKILSDPNRLRIVCLLLGGERCVCEVEEALGISQQLASHHLNVLKEGGILAVRREGTSAYYSVVEDKLGRITEIYLRYLGQGGGCREETGTACYKGSSREPMKTGAGAVRRGGARG